MTRILFVDDEQNILDGLKRKLRRWRGEWTLSFASSGEAALETMDQDPSDVVVSDMRMPGMDGATLLTHVKDRYPGTIRIVLSGYSEQELAMRTVSVAHQFLTKGCEVDRITEVIERACSLRALLDSEELKRFIGSVDSLPSIPQVYDELTKALANPDVTTEEVAAIVEQDAGLTTKILQLVNSSFFGLPRTIASVHEATMYLGLNTVRNLTMSHEVFRKFDAATCPAGFSLEDLHRMSMLTASVARAISPDRITADQAFLGGLLHDIGKLVIATRLPEYFERASGAVSGESDRSFFEAEMRENGVTHAVVGAYLLGIWGMPFPIVEATAYHHDPSSVNHSNLDVLGTVHVANALAREILEGDSESNLDQEWVSKMQLEGQIDTWRAEIAGVAEDMRQLN